MATGKSGRKYMEVYCSKTPSLDMKLYSITSRQTAISCNVYIIPETTAKITRQRAIANKPAGGKMLQ